MRLTTIREAIRKRGWYVVLISEKETIPLIEKIQGSSLFSDNTLYVLEGLAKVTNPDWEWLSKEGLESPANLLIWERKDVPAGVLKKVPGFVNIEKFDYPKYIFNFLDNLYPNNLERGYLLYKEVSEKEALEFVFVMIANLFRDLYWILTDPATCNYPMWRKNKLSQQAKKFGKSKLKKIIKNLAEIDMMVKKGEGVLESKLEMFVLTTLK